MIPSRLESIDDAGSWLRANFGGTTEPYFDMHNRQFVGRRPALKWYPPSGQKFLCTLRPAGFTYGRKGEGKLTGMNHSEVLWQMRNHYNRLVCINTESGPRGYVFNWADVMDWDEAHPEFRKEITWKDKAGRKRSEDEYSINVPVRFAVNLIDYLGLGKPDSRRPKKGGQASLMDV